MNRLSVCAIALMSMAGVAHSQSVEFRIVERTNHISVSPSDSLLELAVQARVTGGALGAFSFDMAIAGEAESNGTLNRARISNSNHTYFTGAPWTTNNTIGQGGMASQYTYLATLSSQSAAFNGSINTSAGSFTNNPNEQEIGLVTGRALDGPMLNTPGMDPNHEGNPATWSGYGSGNPPAPGSLASLAPALAGPYFASGQFIDIYRFTYSVSNFSPRTLNFVLRNLIAENFTRLTTNGIYWGAQDTTVPAGQTSGAPLTITANGGFNLLIPSPASATLLGLGALTGVRRRRAS